jgi:hypothetical protein
MVAFAIALGELFFALALATPVLIGLLGLTVILGLLPIPQIRTFILAVQSTLTATVGDSLAFVESPIRAALIRTCILDGLQRLKQLCKHTVIVANSQGAAVVLDALGGLEPDHEDEPQVASRLVPHALVTFGAGTNQLASLKVLAAGKTLGPNPVFVALWTLLAMVGLLLWLYWNVRAQQLTPEGILWDLLWLLSSTVVGSLVFWLIHLLGRRWALSPGAKRIGIGITTVMMVGVAVLLFHLSLLIIASVMFIASVLIIFSREMKKSVTDPVRTPAGLDRWVDLYASADPVPNGPTRTTDARHKSVPIWNLGSLLADHTAYWNNRDGFVLRVARVCAETAQSPWADALPRASDFVDKRAAWRVGFLRIACWSANLTWLFLGAIVWTKYQCNIPVFGLTSWFPEAPVRFSVLVASIVSAMWATSRVLRWIWNWWVYAEQEAVLTHQQPAEHESYYPLFWMAIVVWMLIAATYFAGKTTNFLEDLKAADNLGYIFAVLWALVTLAFGSAAILLEVRRPPEVGREATTVWYQNKSRIIMGFIVLTWAVTFIFRDRLPIPDTYAPIDWIPVMILAPVVLYVPAMFTKSHPLWFWPAVLLCAFFGLTFTFGDAWLLYRQLAVVLAWVVLVLSHLAPWLMTKFEARRSSG